MKQIKRYALLLALLGCLFLAGCGGDTVDTPTDGSSDSPASTWEVSEESSFDLTEVPEFSGDPYVLINGNVPEFSEEDMTTASYELYGPLDDLGRCTLVEANIGRDLMPTEERGSISHIKPTGWHLGKYDFIDGKYLYNRCHLIGYQLTGENDNELNLITGTRYLNVDGMLPFENFVAEYVEETGNHVLYRVTPIFEDDNLLASGVQMEGMSVEDNGEDIMFNVYCYNVQPGVLIDYETGDHYLGEDLPLDYGSEDDGGSEDGDKDGKNKVTSKDTSGSDVEGKYVLNTSSEKFHYPDCSGVKRMSPDNREDYEGSRKDLLELGYEPCGTCKP